MKYFAEAEDAMLNMAFALIRLKLPAPLAWIPIE
jgi:hypothetical protein